MRRLRISNALACIAVLATLLVGAVRAEAGAIFLTGHDPDFHAVLGGNTTGARAINTTAIEYIMDPLFNPYGSLPFIFVESNLPPPGGHTFGEAGIVVSGYTTGVDYVNHDALTLNTALNGLGTLYGGIVVASDFGGDLRQAELDILNARSADIISFLNSGGGLYAMAESNNGAGLTPGGGHFGFLPFIVTSTGFDQSEVGITVTAFGASLGLTNADVNGNASHNIFTGTGGMQVVDRDQFGNILTLATRSVIDNGGVVSTVPEPATLLLLGSGLAGMVHRRRRSH
jgi:PEP-CTERM motif